MNDPVDVSRLVRPEAWRRAPGWCDWLAFKTSDDMLVGEWCRDKPVWADGTWVSDQPIDSGLTLILGPGTRVAVQDLVFQRPDVDVRVDWSEAPAGAQYHAYEHTGRGWWFSHRPEFSKWLGWVRQAGWQQVSMSKHTLALSTKQASESITQRPIKGFYNSSPGYRCEHPQ